MRNIPAALLDHLQQDQTSTCRILRFILADGRSFGLTSLDQAVTYQGVTYSSVNGFDSSVIATDAGLSVDNSEGYALLSADTLGITLEMIATGQLDNAQWEMLLINYRDLSMGHMIIDAGDTGEITTQDGVAYMPELLSYAMRLRQAIGTVDSRTCRAVFGTPANSQTGCGVNANAFWRAGTVTGVGDESRRVFADSGLLITPAPFPGRVRWTSGRNMNVSRLYQIEAYSSLSGTVALLEPLPFDVQVGDTFDIRPDCAKNPTACTAYGNFINYKGEPLIPIGDGIALLTPGGQLTGGFVGSEVIE